jgi:hypothetical protein
MVFSWLMPWPNNQVNNRYNPVIYYLGTLRDNEAFFGSWLPSGYLLAWLVNFIVYFVEFLAWVTQDEFNFMPTFFVLWAQVALWAGTIVGWMPVVFAIMYILLEYP